MLLTGLEVVLVKTRFPENIGMAARACANMGCPILRLVQPERWDREKAAPLATAQGLKILDGVTVHAHLSQAVGHCSLVIGTTARVGGWRRSSLAPHAAALAVATALQRGECVSLVFGPEDRGLNNDEVMHCPQLTTIPTDAAAHSLNLAQAVLLMTYECANAVRSLHDTAYVTARGQQYLEGKNVTSGGRKATAAEQERLMLEFKEMLLRLDYLHGDNPEYFLQPWRRLFGRCGLLRHEYDALMGLCRQVRNKIES